MKQTLKDLVIHFNEPILVMYDNTSAINISKNPMMHSHIKHIDIRNHFLKEKVTKGEVKFDFIPMIDHIVDIFTKPLPMELFEYIHKNYGWLYFPRIRPLS